MMSFSVEALARIAIDLQSDIGHVVDRQRHKLMGLIAQQRRGVAAQDLPQGGDQARKATKRYRSRRPLFAPDRHPAADPGLRRLGAAAL
jgi:hypothetical protein